jgi:hypothetical protein
MEALELHARCVVDDEIGFEHGMITWRSLAHRCCLGLVGHLLDRMLKGTAPAMARMIARRPPTSARPRRRRDPEAESKGANDDGYGSAHRNSGDMTGTIDKCCRAAGERDTYF